ncbi:hypothetical protein RFI_13497 [Reticulomyxa filosa]|uniref:Vacuolar protein 14 C-terminal Fig4-binding domain-containing protein n=1 Tax=Reticulomyxa filosa TaxID=46433 RepID=X6NEA8_RETFI|nr:hypothetical protein RFI_13497 [Reticulomyxa filosa]|eukprot:ETO23682.1 hypothetical protein RFI_13497 [Reticulomyxa filosa]
MFVELQLNLDTREIEENVGLFPVLLNLLCDSDDQVLQQTLSVLAQISANDRYFHVICVNLLIVFKQHTDLLASRGKLIVEKLCELLGSTKVYMALVDKLVSEKIIYDDLEFCSLIVQSLNLILLTTDSKTMDELRSNIKNCQSNSDYWKLFATLFHAWSYNPVASLSLCLLGNVYPLGMLVILK